MKFKQRQKRKDSIEKITGKPWYVWHPEAVKAYFLYTDMGIYQPPDGEALKEFEELYFCHRQHPITVELWKEDFRKGLLFLDDFLFPEFDYQLDTKELDDYYEFFGISAPRIAYRSISPKSYLRHVCAVYYSVFKYIPRRYRRLLIA